MFFKKRNTRTYLDYASTTPVDGDVAALVSRLSQDNWHNPSSLHAEGVKAGKVLEDARERVARIVRCRAEEIVFTSSGTEANNLAVVGVLKAAGSGARFVTTTVEHPAVSRIADAVRGKKLDPSWFVFLAHPQEDGRIDTAALVSALHPDTAIVSVIHANNEYGTVIDTRSIRRALDEYKKSLGRTIDAKPYLHIDASQSPCHLSIDRQHLGADLLTLDGSKIYGPKGVGMLYVRRGIPIETVTYGGSQENNLRPGTQNVPAIAGFALALEKCEQLREKEVARLTELRDTLIEGILKVGEKLSKNITINGYWKKGASDVRIANNVNVCVEGIDAELIVLRLDAEGIACSAAASCSSLSDDGESEALRGLGKPECAGSSLRFTLGRGTTKMDIQKVIVALEKVLKI